MPGLAEGGGQIPDAPVPICSPTLGSTHPGCRCSPGCPRWVSTPAQPLPASACRASHGTRWLWAAWPFSRQLLHLCIFSFAVTLAAPSWLGAGALRSAVASIPPLPGQTSFGPSDCPALWVTQPPPARLARVP